MSAGFWVFLGILLFFVFLLSISIKLTVICKDSVTVYVSVLGIRFPIVPKKKKKLKVKKYSKKALEKRRRKEEKKLLKKEQKKNKKDEKKKKKAEKSEKEEEEKPKKSLSDILALVRTVCAALRVFLRKFFRYMKIKAAKIHISVGMDDAYKTAMAYGAISQSVSYLCALLSRFTNFDTKGNTTVSVEADFISEKIKIDIHLIFKIRIWQIFSIAFASLFTFLKRFLSSQKKKEPKKQKASS